MKFSDKYEEEFPAELHANRSSLRITIPPVCVKKLKLKKGQYVKVNIRCKEVDKMQEAELLKKIEKLEEENASLKETVEILQDPLLMKRFQQKGSGKLISIEELEKRLKEKQIL